MMSNRVMSLIFAAAVTLFGFSPATLAQAPKQIPRTPEGKPNFAGLWVGGGGDGPRATRAAIARELPLTAWGREQVAYSTRGDGEYPGETGAAEDPRFHSLCGGPSSPANVGGRIEISQNPRRLFLVYFGDFTRMWARQFWIGREHPKDLSPTWMGDSIGRWEGNTLVVDTTGFNDKAWLDQVGHPRSDALHLVERIRRVDHDTMRVDLTIDDSKAYTKPWTGEQIFKLRPGWHLIEYVCEDNMDVPR